MITYHNVFIVFHVEDVVLILLDEALHFVIPKSELKEEPISLQGSAWRMSLCRLKKQPTPLKIKELEEPWLAEARKQALLNTPMTGTGSGWP
jgi:hypothetical protein